MFKSTNVYLRPLMLVDAEELLELQLRNRNLFEKYSITRTEDYYTLVKQQELLKKKDIDAKEDREYNFGIFKLENDELIGNIQLFKVSRGPSQSAGVGYVLDEKENGKGYMTEAVKLIVRYAFEDLHLHRLEAGVMPLNIGSIRVLEKAGFHREGIAKKNVKINGQWEDHLILAIINPNEND